MQWSNANLQKSVESSEIFGVEIVDEEHIVGNLEWEWERTRENGGCAVASHSLAGGSTQIPRARSLASTASKSNF